MTERRWTEKPDLDPASVWGLPQDHPAMTGNRTLFPGTVVEVTREAPDRLLVSGRNNLKLGDTVAKGTFSGRALYGLSLEERATCPVSCEVRDVCYGNGMHHARRHRIVDLATFRARLDAEIRANLERHPAGLLVRLHVLGDFPDPAYVAVWGSLLDEHPGLACYGYTHRRPSADGGDETGDALDLLKRRHPGRFRIRWSSMTSGPDRAVVVGAVPAAPRTPAGIACPAQTDATACCASCGLCWEPAAAGETILFVRHGRPSGGAAARAASPPSVAGRRPVVALDLPPKLVPAPLPGAVPSFRMVPPTSLLVEDAYQRDLSAKSIRLIRRIVSGWDWAKFKPPVCARTPDGLFVLDGQHTAIAAASHPGIDVILVVVVDVPEVEGRADAFVAHNRDRVAMTALQVFVAEVAAGSAEARAVLEAVVAAGGRIPRTTPGKGRARAGDLVAIADARRVHAAQGPGTLSRIVRLSVAAGTKPINTTVVRGLQALLSEPRFAEAAALPDATLAAAIASFGDLEAAAHQYAANAGMSRFRAYAVLAARAALSPALTDAA